MLPLLSAPRATVDLPAWQSLLCPLPGPCRAQPPPLGTVSVAWWPVPTAATSPDPPAASALSLDPVHLPAPFLRPRAGLALPTTGLSGPFLAFSSLSYSGGFTRPPSPFGALTSLGESPEKLGSLSSDLPVKASPAIGQEVTGLPLCLSLQHPGASTVPPGRGAGARPRRQCQLQVHGPSVRQAQSRRGACALPPLPPAPASPWAVSMVLFWFLSGAELQPRPGDGE